jgi:hypothetical protein
MIVEMVAATTAVLIAVTLPIVLQAVLDFVALSVGGSRLTMAPMPPLPRRTQAKVVLVVVVTTAAVIVAVTTAVAVRSWN